MGAIGSCVDLRHANVMIWLMAVVLMVMKEVQRSGQGVGNVYFVRPCHCICNKWSMQTRRSTDDGLKLALNGWVDLGEGYYVEDI